MKPKPTKKTLMSKTEITMEKETTPKTPHPFTAIRRAAVPLAAFETADPAQTIQACMKALNGKICPVLQWDACNGLRGVNREGEKIIPTISQDPMELLNFTGCFSLVAQKYNPGEGRAATFFAHCG